MYSDRLEDKAAKVSVYGKDHQNLDVRDECCSGAGEFGASLPLNPIRILAGGMQKPSVGDEVCADRKTLIPKYSRSRFNRISHITKPITKGYVWVFEFCPADGTYKTLAMLHPNSESSCYGVWRLRPAFSQLSSLNILAKRRYIPAVVDSDVLYIQSMPALYEAVQMLYQGRNENPKSAGIHEEAARTHLGDQLSNMNRGASMEMDVDSTWGGGQITNLG